MFANDLPRIGPVVSNETRDPAVAAILTPSYYVDVLRRHADVLCEASDKELEHERLLRRWEMASVDFTADVTQRAGVTHSFDAFPADAFRPYTILCLEPLGVSAVKTNADGTVNLAPWLSDAIRDTFVHDSATRMPPIEAVASRTANVAKEYFDFIQPRLITLVGAWSIHRRKCGGAAGFRRVEQQQGANASLLGDTFCDTKEGLMVHIWADASCASLFHRSLQLVSRATMFSSGAPLIVEPSCGGLIVPAALCCRWGDLRISILPLSPLLRDAAFAVNLDFSARGDSMPLLSGALQLLRASMLGNLANSGTTTNGTAATVQLRIGADHRLHIVDKEFLFCAIPRLTSLTSSSLSRSYNLPSAARRELVAQLCPALDEAFHFGSAVPRPPVPRWDDVAEDILHRCRQVADALRDTAWKFGGVVEDHGAKSRRKSTEGDSLQGARLWMDASSVILSPLSAHTPAPILPEAAVGSSDASVSEKQAAEQQRLSELQQRVRVKSKVASALFSQRHVRRVAARFGISVRHLFLVALYLRMESAGPTGDAASAARVELIRRKSGAVVQRSSDQFLRSHADLVDEAIVEAIAAELLSRALKRVHRAEYDLTQRNVVPSSAVKRAAARSGSVSDVVALRVSLLNRLFYSITTKATGVWEKAVVPAFIDLFVDAIPMELLTFAMAHPSGGLLRRVNAAQKLTAADVEAIVAGMLPPIGPTPLLLQCAIAYCSSALGVSYSATDRSFVTTTALVNLSLRSASNFCRLRDVMMVADAQDQRRAASKLGELGRAALSTMTEAERLLSGFDCDNDDDDEDGDDGMVDHVEDGDVDALGCQVSQADDSKLCRASQPGQIIVSAVHGEAPDAFCARVIARFAVVSSARLDESDSMAPAAKLLWAFEPILRGIAVLRRLSSQTLSALPSAVAEHVAPLVARVHHCIPAAYVLTIALLRNRMLPGAMAVKLQLLVSQTESGKFIESWGARYKWHRRLRKELGDSEQQQVGADFASAILAIDSDGDQSSRCCQLEAVGEEMVTLPVFLEASHFAHVKDCARYFSDRVVLPSLRLVATHMPSDAASLHWKESAALYSMLCRVVVLWTRQRRALLHQNAPTRMRAESTRFDDDDEDDECRKHPSSDRCRLDSDLRILVSWLDDHCYFANKAPSGAPQRCHLRTGMLLGALRAVTSDCCRPLRSQNGGHNKNAHFDDEAVARCSNTIPIATRSLQLHISVFGPDDPQTGVALAHHAFVVLCAKAAALSRVAPLDITLAGTQGQQRLVASHDDDALVVDTAVPEVHCTDALQVVEELRSEAFRFGRLRVADFPLILRSEAFATRMAAASALMAELGEWQPAEMVLVSAQALQDGATRLTKAPNSAPTSAKDESPSTPDNSVAAESTTAGTAIQFATRTADAHRRVELADGEATFSIKPLRLVEDVASHPRHQSEAATDRRRSLLSAALFATKQRRDELEKGAEKLQRLLRGTVFNTPLRVSARFLQQHQYFAAGCYCIEPLWRFPLLFLELSRREALMRRAVELEWHAFFEPVPGAVATVLREDLRRLLRLRFLRMMEFERQQEGFLQQRRDAVEEEQRFRETILKEEHFIRRTFDKINKDGRVAARRAADARKLRDEVNGVPRASEVAMPPRSLSPTRSRDSDGFNDRQSRVDLATILRTGPDAATSGSLPPLRFGAVWERRSRRQTVEGDGPSQTTPRPRSAQRSAKETNDQRRAASGSRRSDLATQRHMTAETVRSELRHLRESMERQAAEESAALDLLRQRHEEERRAEAARLAAIRREVAVERSRRAAAVSAEIALLRSQSVPVASSSRTPPRSSSQSPLRNESPHPAMVVPRSRVDIAALRNAKQREAQALARARREERKTAREAAERRDAEERLRRQREAEELRARSGMFEEVVAHERLCELIDRRRTVVGLRFHVNVDEL